MAHSAWQLSGYEARTRLGGHPAHLDLLYPAEGLVFFPGHHSPWRLFSVDLPDVEPSAAGKSLEFHVRGDDLIVSYPRTNSGDASGQLYWRKRIQAAGRGEFEGVEVVVSAQTSLLDSDPAMRVRSRFPAGEVLHLNDPFAPHSGILEVGMGNDSRTITAAEGAGCFLCRPADLEMSYLEIVHPLDFRESLLAKTLGADAAIEISHRLFGGRLEKGVILRSRLLGVLLPREGDLALAEEIYRRFADSEPPLTT